MTQRMNHLLIFSSVAIVAWIIGTLLLVYFWPHLVNGIYKRAILNQGFGEGPVPINTLYTEPQMLFAEPLTAQTASGSNLATVGVNHDTLLVVGWLDLSKGPQVLRVPDFAGRYYSVQFTDPFNIDFACRHPCHWHASGRLSYHGARLERTVPNGMKQISSEDNSVLVIGRILVYNDSDLPTAYNLAKQIQLTLQNHQ